MNLGGQTVQLRTFTAGTVRNRLNQVEQGPAAATWSGVLMRPASGGEDVTLTDIATQEWWCTGPPIPAAVNATATAELVYDNDTYRVTKVETFSDLAGVLSHVRVTCQRQSS